MEQTKNWYKSKTTWFGVFHLVALAMLKIFGVDLTDSVAQMAEGLVVAIVAVEGIVIVVLRAVTKAKIKPPGGGAYSLLLVMCLIGVMAVCGCNAVNVSPEYSALLNSTAAWSQAMADKAAAGEMDEAQKTEALQVNADLWRRFEDAKNGTSD